MLKKLVILMAAISVLSACNDSDNTKKSKATAKPAVEAQGQDKGKEGEEEVEQTEELTEQQAADAELKAKILANDWCITKSAPNAEEKITVVLGNSVREESTSQNVNMTLSDYRETEDTVSLIEQRDGNLAVEDGKVKIQSFVTRKDGRPETTLAIYHVQFLNDQFSKTMVLSQYPGQDTLKYGEYFYGCDESVIAGEEVEIEQTKTAAVEEVVQEKK